MTPAAPPVDALLAQAVAARQAGRLGEATTLFGQVLTEGPPHPQVLLLAGETLYRLGLLRSAQVAVTTAQVLRPDDPGADLLLGRILVARSQPAEALAAFERATATRPQDALGWRFRATALSALGQLDEARSMLAKADRLQPESAEGYNQFGISLLSERRAAEAELLFRQALALDPNLLAAWQNLGAALAAQDRLGEAIDAERQAVERQPRSAAGWTNLGAFANAAGRFREARQALQRAYALAPDAADTLNNLANLRLEEGDSFAACGLLETALRATPGHRSATDNFLLARNYITETAGPDWLPAARQAVAAIRPDAPPFPHRGLQDRHRRLRVGFVSADFRRHSCASFLAPLFAYWPHAELELFAYSDNHADDEVTVGLKSHVDGWQPVTGLGDIALAEQISDDHIDILVDLAGHMAGNRLPVFALRPAPVQVSWLGYPDTTGLDAIDYRLTDAIADPPGQTEHLHSETLWRLPECFLAFGAAPTAPEDERESRSTGLVFGSFNHLPKVTPAVVTVWARLLQAVPGSRLVLKAKRLGEPETRERYLSLFAAAGIAADRLDLIGWRDAPADHLALYRGIDIALDPFPYNGTTTTCEALAMGVPVITLAGTRHAARVGASLLAAAGLEQLVAFSVDDYVSRAVELAGDTARRHGLAGTLHRTLATSTLCDGKRFAARFAAALREMWIRQCEKGG